jgi:phosphate transport system substrate-binding protein
VNLTGAGATFPYPLYRAWFAEYGQRSGARVNYLAVGSAEGLRLLDHGDVDFGASDLPILSASDARPPGCARVAVPTVQGPIAVAYNLPLSGARQTPLRFDAELLADVFSGRIRRWSAPKIAERNPGVIFPDLPITVVHRGTGSGTSRAFSDFLSSSGQWAGGRVGDTSEVQWPVGVAAEGNAGVAVEVKVTVGAIGYVELSYARQNKLSVAAVKSRDGSHLTPGLDAPGYPISAHTWLVIDPVRLKAERGPALVAFVQWALHDGAEQARAMEYAPVSADSVSRYDALLKAMTFQQCAGSHTK